jgi:glycerol uptake facilitator-like aquaporin
MTDGGGSHPFTLSRRLTAEGLGTAMLLATVVGSGIMGERLAGGIIGIALMANAVATGAVLIVLILMFGPVSGAHFNPAVTLAFLMRHWIGGRDAALYVVTQVAGALAGVVVAHLMFDEPLLQVSTRERGGVGQWTGEVVATFALVGAILGCLRWWPQAVAYAVGLVITAGYWFTSSTSFANPAVTIARSFTDTFSGIAPASAPGFIAAQILGAGVATLLLGWLFARGGTKDGMVPESAKGNRPAAGGATGRSHAA